MEVVFKLLDWQLNKDGFIMNSCKMVDASFVDVPIQRNSRDENEKIKKGRFLKTGTRTSVVRKRPMHAGPNTKEKVLRILERCKGKYGDQVTDGLRGFACEQS